MLHAEYSGSGPRLVLAHGFTQTARSWGRFATLVACGRELVSVDLPGHGGSSAVRAGLSESAELLAATGSSGCARFDLLGYSLGARVALHAALHLAASPLAGVSAPSPLRRLVLIGATAGIEEPGARQERRHRDDELAQEVELDLEQFLRRWVAAPMFWGLRDPGIAERRRNSAQGLASSLRLAGTGTQLPLWERLNEIRCPVLVVAGADDVRFAVRGLRMARTFPNAAFSLVPGAGHAAHLAQPELCARIVTRFLE